MKKIYLSALILSVAVLTGCSDNTQSVQTESTPAQTQQQDKIAHQNSEFGKIPDKETARASYVVVSQPSYPPFATRDEMGTTIGLDIDILSAIAEKENIHLDFTSHDMTGLLETVNNGQADIVATGVNITEERQKIYDFSKPYMEANWVVLMDGAKGEKVTSFAQLQDKPIATQENSLSQTFLQQTKITSNIVPVKTVFLGLSAVAKGDAVGVYDVDSVLNTYIQPNNQLYTVTDVASGKVPFGFVIKQGNTELKDILDKGIDGIKADGTYDKIVQKWYPSKLSVTQ